MKTDVLYYGDNLEILRKYIPDNSVDLIYLDPLFSSKKVDMPPTSIEFFPKAPRISKREGEQIALEEQ